MSIYCTDDPVADYDRWDAERENWLSKLPTCCRCNHPIQTEKMWVISGEFYCRECAEDEFERYTEDYT